MVKLPTWGGVVALAAILGTIPLYLAYADFGLHAATHPADAENNTAKAGEVMVKEVENELPWWMDPIGFLFLCLFAFLILLGIGIWNKGGW